MYELSSGSAGSNFYIKTYSFDDTYISNITIGGNATFIYSYASVATGLGLGGILYYMGSD